MDRENNDILLYLKGSRPGLCDPSQRTRLLRTPHSTLFFASYDAHTARPDLPDISSLRVDPNKTSKSSDTDRVKRSNGKRVVIESDPETSSCIWRFVPRAKTEMELYGDEGSWPRTVELCGCPVIMTQDQWDIHKLDPAYECIVRVPPKLTTITRKSSPNIIPPEATSPCDLPRTPSRPTVDAMADTPSPNIERRVPRASTSENHDRKNSIKVELLVDDEDDNDQMAVDDEIFFATTPGYKPKPDGVNEKKRRRHSLRLGRNASDIDYKKEKSQENSEKAGESPSDRRSGKSKMPENSEPDVPPSPKRTRDISPRTIKRFIFEGRNQRERKRKVDWEARLRMRKEALEQAFWSQLGVPPEVFTSQYAPDDLDDSEHDSEDNPGEPAAEDEETARLAKIEESRRKLAELEKDKPIWEETARKRQAREKEEEGMRQRAQELRKAQEREQRDEAAKRQFSEYWEKGRLEREHERRKQEKRGRMFIYGPRGSYRWNLREALDRYLATAAVFDTAKFSPAKPLTFASIPWPMLPASYSIQEVEWEAVETFFDKVRMFFSDAQFKEFVETSQRRFHPDRWRSRGILASVNDDLERDLLEVAGSTVAQSITPLWNEVTGRS